MAKPIKETPVLEGKDAVNFLKSIEETKKTIVKTEEIIRIKESFDKLQSIANFSVVRLFTHNCYYQGNC